MVILEGGSPSRPLVPYRHRPGETEAAQNKNPSGFKRNNSSLLKTSPHALFVINWDYFNAEVSEMRGCEVLIHCCYWRAWEDSNPRPTD